MTISHSERLELNEDEAWEYYSYLVSKQVLLSDRLQSATEARDKQAMRSILEESEVLARRMRHIEEFLERTV